MSVLDFIDSEVFKPEYDNDVPLIQSPNIDSMCREIKYAIKNGETIMVYGDYDVDGMFSMLVWKETFALLRAKAPVLFEYRNKTHRIDKDLITQAREADASLVIICDTGSSAEDRVILNELATDGRTPIVIDHHVFEGDYNLWTKYYHIFNSYSEIQALGGAEVSGAYACLLVAKVLCEKYMDATLAFNAKVYALGSMYSDVVDMSSPIARALYSSVAMANAPGPEFLVALNEWNYLYGRRFFSFIVAPKLNGCFRMEKVDLLNDILRCTEKWKYTKLCEELSQVHSDAKQLVKGFVRAYERVKVGEIMLCIHEATPETRSLNIRNFTGVVATQIAQEEKCPVICVVYDNHHYSGSYRDYYNRGLINLFSLFSECGGHPSAFGITFSNLSEFKRHCNGVSEHLDVTVERPHIILNSGVIESEADLDALALYNEYANVKRSVVISHTCRTLVLKRGTKYSKYYDVGLPTSKVVMTKRPLLAGATILIEPALCRGVELREME